MREFRVCKEEFEKLFNHTLRTSKNIGFDYQVVANSWEEKRFDTLEEAKQYIEKNKNYIDKGEGFAIEQIFVDEDGDEYFEYVCGFNYNQLED